MHVHAPCLILPIIFVHLHPCRYLARVILVPFVLESGEVTLDKLKKIQEEVVSAFPEVLRIGYFLENCDAAHIYSLRDEIIAMVGAKFDSRLATHYAFNLACALKVCFNCILAPSCYGVNLCNSHVP